MPDGDFDLADAYAVETPDDNRDLYARWAATYESAFIADNGYVSVSYTHLTLPTKRIV